MSSHRKTTEAAAYSRRHALKLCGLGGLTSALPGLLASQVRGESATQPPANSRLFGQAKRVILLFLSGGPPQHETFDPKPGAPAEIRGPFRPINTNVPGIHFSELLPRTAARADKLAVIRSMYTNNHIHGGSGYWVLTGRPLLTSDGENATPNDWPNLASIVKRFLPSQQMPALTSVTLPELMIGNGGNIHSGQFGGILGPQFASELIECRPAEPSSPLGGLYTSRVSSEQMRQRQSLLDALGNEFNQTPRSAVVQLHDGLQRQAFDLITTGTARKAFSLDDEPDSLRERYGRHPWGQSVLLARRLIESGVRFVTVNWPRVPGDRGTDNPLWDTHARNFDRMEDCLAPQFDVGYTALLDDLSDRGLLDETLVIAVGEFGRTPTVNANAGRDHWGNVFSCVLAGGGIAGGQVYGSSDRDGAYPAADPVDAGHLAATVFHLVGINPQGTFHDRLGREVSIADADPLYKLLGEEPATSARTNPAGDIASVPPYRKGLLLHPDFVETTTIPGLDAPPSPKGWRASMMLGHQNGFGVRVLDGNNSGRVGAVGIWTNSSGDPVEASAKLSMILAQQIRDPQCGNFVVKATVFGDGTSSDVYRDLFERHFRCRLVLFQLTHAGKSITQRMELASVEFVPVFQPDATNVQRTIVTLEKRLAPTPGANFTFGLGIGVAILVEQKSEQPLRFTSRSGDAFIRVEQIAIDFEGWKFG